VNCALNQTSHVQNEIKNVNGVLESYPITGIYDLLVKVEAVDEAKLKEVIRNLKGIFGVTSILTSIIYMSGNLAAAILE
jgi:DNA-binding Lrp family transcriptional regulator